MPYEYQPLDFYYPRQERVGCVDPVRVSDIEQHRDEIVAWYARLKDPNHDVMHVTRMLILALEQARSGEEKGVRVDRTVLKQSCLHHDIASNPNNKPDHADEAARLIYPLLMENKSLTRPQVFQIVNNVRWHNKPYDQIPLYVWKPEFIFMTNADALDLVRFKQDMRVLLTTNDAVALSPKAEQLYEASIRMQTHDPFNDVMQAAKSMGLVVADEEVL